MLEVLGVDDVDLPHHAQVFDGQHHDLLLFQLVHTGALGQYGNAEVPADQILDGGDVVDLQNHVEIVDAQVLAFQTGHEEVAGAGVRQTEDHLLLLQFADGHQAPVGQPVPRRDRQHQTVRVQNQVFQTGVVDLALYDGEIQLVILEHVVQIALRIRDDLDGHAAAAVHVPGQRFGNGVALRRVGDAHGQGGQLALFTGQVLAQIVVEGQHPPGVLDDHLALVGHVQLVVRPLKNAHVQFALQRADVLAHGGLGQG